MSRQLLELRGFLLNIGNQVGKRLGEARDALFLKLCCNRLKIDTYALEVGHSFTRSIQIRIHCATDVAVISERLNRRLWHRIDRIRSDQFLDVYHVTVSGVLGAGACPQRSLNTRALRLQLLETGIVKNLAEATIRQLRVGNRSLALQAIEHGLLRLGRFGGDLLVELLIDQRIDAADEERSHRSQPINRLPGFDSRVSEHKRFWTFYNDTDQPIDAIMIALDPRPDSHFYDCWNDLEVELSDGGLRVILKPRNVGAVVELPHLIHYEPDTQTIHLRDTIPDAELVVTDRGGNRIYTSGEALITLPQLERQEQIMLELIRGSEILDCLLWTPE